jgi:hypothetical protein
MSVEGSNPTPAAAPDSRASLVAELNALPVEGAAESKPAAAPDSAAAEPPAEAAPAEQALSDDATGAEADDVSDTPAPAPKADVELAKRLDAIKAAERRSRDEIAKARAELEAQRKEIAEQTEALKRRFKADPIAVMRELGASTSEDWDLVSRAAWANTEKAAQNPQTREAAMRALKERETTDAVAHLRDELTAVRKELAERDAKANAERQSAAYLTAVSKSLDDSTPIVKTLFDKNPTLAQQRVQLARDYLHQQTGEIPEPGDVLKMLEQVERDELAYRGIDPDQLLKTTKPVSTPAAGETRSAKTLSNDLTKQTKPRTAPATPEEERAELLRALEAGQLE